MANEKHAAYRENFKITFGLAGDYAKRLLSTLLLLNSGAIAGIFQKDMARVYLESICCFGAGVFFALISGIVGWFNLQIAAAHYFGAAADILSGKDDRRMPVSIAVTRWVAVVAAFESIAFQMLGAILIVRSLR